MTVSCLQPAFARSAYLQILSICGGRFAHQHRQLIVLINRSFLLYMVLVSHQLKNNLYTHTNDSFKRKAGRHVLPNLLNTVSGFDVLLTVHLGITLANDQLDTQFLYLIIGLLQSSTCFEHRRAHHQESNFINTASDIVTLCKWPSGAPDGHLQ